MFKPRTAIKWALIASVLLYLGIGALWLQRPHLVLFTALTLAGRNPHCSLFDVLRVPRLYRVIQFPDEVGRQCRIVRRDGAMALWRTPIGDFWAPQNSAELPVEVAEQMTSFYGVGRQAVQPGDVVIDCGANIGLFVSTALSKGASRVVAVEPGEENLRCLRRNFSAEIASGRVTVVEQGVWSREGTLLFAYDPQNSGADKFIDSGIPPPGERSAQLPVTTVDKLVSALGLSRVDFIKMDIEGAERHALAGARAVMSRYRPRLAICTYHKPDDPEVIPAIIRSANPAYHAACGLCAPVPGGRYVLRPEVVFFN